MEVSNGTFVSDLMLCVILVKVIFPVNEGNVCLIQHVCCRNSCEYDMEYIVTIIIQRIYFL